MSVVVVATHNAKKAVELHRVLAAAGVDADVRGLDAFPAYPEPAETERTFEGNALLKARAAVAHTGLLAVADDSGLEVDLLNGMPGVLSARWSGGGGDVANLELVLAQLGDTPDERLDAFFTCAVALVLPDGREAVVHGEMPGRLIRKARGTNGFGYDPLFYFPQIQKTFAELTAEEKANYSHRGAAFRKFLGWCEKQFPEDHI